MGSDHSGARALWLSLMGFVQISLGVGFIVRAYVIPAVLRFFSSARATESGTFAIPGSRGVSVR
jgi:hypothetical protein